MHESQPTLGVLPAFADRENRELDASVQALMASLKVTSAEVAAQSARGAAMVEHLRHVQLELASSQLRRDARVKELATEDHMRRLNAGEAVRHAHEQRASFRSQPPEHARRMPQHHTFHRRQTNQKPSSSSRAIHASRCGLCPVAGEAGEGGKGPRGREGKAARPYGCPGGGRGASGPILLSRPERKSLPG